MARADISIPTDTLPTMTNIGLSRRVSSLKASVTVAMMNRAKQMQASGIDVLSFAAGEPDFDTPDAIKQAAIDALRAGQTKYMPTLGDMQTRQVIADKLTNENGIPGLKGEHIAISSGGKHSLFVLCHCLLDTPAPGEQPWEVVHPGSGLGQLRTHRRVGRRPGCRGSDNRRLRIQSHGGADPPRDHAAQPHAHPEQPEQPVRHDVRRARSSGRSQAVVRRSRATGRPHLVILSDEIYEKIVYGGIPHFSIGSVPEVAERTITLNGLSKAYAMTGWRIGYTAVVRASGASSSSNAMATLQGQMSTNITSFVYPAIRTALLECNRRSAADVRGLSRSAPR
jgi:aspartate aminotransferase